MDGTMAFDASVLLISTGWKLFLAFLSVPLVFIILRFADFVLQINFRDKMRGMGDVAFGVYTGLRFLGVCVLVGFALL